MYSVVVRSTETNEALLRIISEGTALARNTSQVLSALNKAGIEFKADTT